MLDTSKLHLLTGVDTITYFSTSCDQADIYQLLGETRESLVKFLLSFIDDTSTRNYIVEDVINFYTLQILTDEKGVEITRAFKEQQTEESKSKMYEHCANRSSYAAYYNAILINEKLPISYRSVICCAKKKKVTLHVFKKLDTSLIELAKTESQSKEKIYLLSDDGNLYHLNKSDALIYQSIPAESTAQHGAQSSKLKKSDQPLNEELVKRELNKQLIGFCERYRNLDESFQDFQLIAIDFNRIITRTQGYHAIKCRDKKDVDKILLENIKRHGFGAKDLQIIADESSFYLAILQSLHFKNLSEIQGLIGYGIYKNLDFLQKKIDTHGWNTILLIEVASLLLNINIVVISNDDCPNHELYFCRKKAIHTICLGYDVVIQTYGSLKMPETGWSESITSIVSKFSLSTTDEIQPLECWKSTGHSVAIKTKSCNELNPWANELFRFSEKQFNANVLTINLLRGKLDELRYCENINRQAQIIQELYKGLMQIPFKYGRSNLEKAHKGKWPEAIFLTKIGLPCLVTKLASSKGDVAELNKILTTTFKDEFIKDLVIVIDNFYYFQLQEEVFSFNQDCDVLSVHNKNLTKFVHDRSTYIFTEDKLYYFNEKIIKEVEATPEIFSRLREIANPSKTIKTLSHEQLKAITSTSRHTRSTVKFGKKLLSVEEKLRRMEQEIMIIEAAQKRNEKDRTKYLEEVEKNQKGFKLLDLEIAFLNTLKSRKDRIDPKEASLKRDCLDERLRAFSAEQRKKIQEIEQIKSAGSKSKIDEMRINALGEEVCAIHRITAFLEAEIYRLNVLISWIEQCILKEPFDLSIQNLLEAKMEYRSQLSAKIKNQQEFLQLISSKSSKELEALIEEKTVEKKYCEESYNKDVHELAELNREIDQKKRKLAESKNMLITDWDAQYERYCKLKRERNTLTKKRGEEEAVLQKKREIEELNKLGLDLDDAKLGELIAKKEELETTIEKFKTRIEGIAENIKKLESDLVKTREAESKVKQLSELKKKHEDFKKQNLPCDVTQIKLNCLAEYQTQYDQENIEKILRTHLHRMETADINATIMLTIADFIGWQKEYCGPTMKVRIEKLVPKEFWQDFRGLRNTIKHSLDDIVRASFATWYATRNLATAKKSLIEVIKFLLTQENLNFLQNTAAQPNKIWEIKPETVTACKALPELPGRQHADGSERYLGLIEQIELFSSSVANGNKLLSLLKNEITEDSKKGYVLDKIITIIESTSDPDSDNDLKIKMKYDVLVQALGQALGNLSQYDTLTYISAVNFPCTHDWRALNDCIMHAREYRSARTHNGYYNSDSFRAIMQGINFSEIILKQLDTLSQKILSSTTEETELSVAGCSFQ